MAAQGILRCFAPWLNPAAVVLGLAAGAAAHASPVTYQFSGTVTFTHTVPLGTPFTGTLTFDPEGRTYSEYLSYTYADRSGDSFWSDPVTLLMNPVGLSLRVGGQTVLTDNFQSAHLTSAGDERKNTIYVQSDPGNAPVNVTLTLSNTQKFLSLAPGPNASDWFGASSPIPKTLSLSAYPYDRIVVPDSTNGFGYEGTIDSLTVVPEPSTATVMCVAVDGWLSGSRRLRLRRSPRAKPS
jgi:hypothetical protein